MGQVNSRHLHRRLGSLLASFVPTPEQCLRVSILLLPESRPFCCGGNQGGTESDVQGSGGQGSSFYTVHFRPAHIDR